MKKVKLISLILSVLLIVSIFPGCGRHYNKDEIAEWAKENIGSPIYISSGCFERPTADNENYTELVWTAYLPDMPDLKFEIVSHASSGMFGAYYNIYSTYGYVYGQYYFEQYCKTHKTDFTAEDEDVSYYNYYLHIYFSDREDLGRVMAQAKELTEYMEEKGIAEYITMNIEYDDVLAAVDDTDVYSYVRCNADIDELEEDILSEFAVYAADYRLEVDQFTTEELIAAAEKFNTQFNITRPDGTVVSYSDLSLSRYSYGMSFGCLYEVLSREGFEVDGTPEHFTYVGIDGCNYEFSYSFNDYVYDNGKPGYYYLKDEEKVPMSYYFYNHFRSGFLQEISGLTFEQI